MLVWEIIIRYYIIGLAWLKEHRLRHGIIDCLDHKQKKGTRWKTTPTITYFFNDFLGTPRNTKMTIVKQNNHLKKMYLLFKKWRVSIDMTCFSGDTTLILNELVWSPQQLGIRKCQNPHRWRPAPENSPSQRKMGMSKWCQTKRARLFCKIIHNLKWMYSATSWLKIVMTWWFNNSNCRGVNAVNLVYCRVHLYFNYLFGGWRHFFAIM